jgi:hypothetical protein
MSTRRAALLMPPQPNKESRMRPTPRVPPASRWLPLALAAFALGGLPGLASAQSLQELYEAARAYDATYLAARRWPSRPSTAPRRPKRWPGRRPR